MAIGAIKVEKECVRTSGKPTKKEIVWNPKTNPSSKAYRFDKTMHFQYHGALAKDPLNLRGFLLGYNLSLDTRSIPAGIIGLLADLTNSHHLTCRRNPDWFRKNVSPDTMSLSPVDDGGSVGSSEVFGSRKPTSSEGVTTSPVVTDVVNNRNVLTPTHRDTANQPSIDKTMCECFFSQIGNSPITVFTGSPLPIPTATNSINSDILNKFNSILGGEFVYSEKQRVFIMEV